MPGKTWFSLLGMWFLFPLQLLAAIALFCGAFPRRKLFALRLTLSLAAIAGLSCIWSDGASGYTGLIILRYLLLFAASFAAMLVCFRISALQALFCAAGGYALQHLSYVIASGASEALNMTVLPDLAVALIYGCIFAVLYLFGYLAFASRMKSAADMMRREKNIVLFSACVLLCVTVFSAVYDTAEAAGSVAAIIACRGFEAMCCLLSLGLMLSIFRSKKAEVEMHGLQVLWEQEKQQYKLTKDRVDLINIKCHDIKKYISQLRGGGKVSDAEVSELESQVSLYDRAVHTGNEVIDVLLADKSLSCEKEGIRLSCMVDGKLFSFLSSSDTYSLFGNILDNAVAAAARVPEPERRVVSLTSTASAGMLFLHAENYFAGEVRMEAGIPQTSTGDEAHHGFGTRSIAYIARKYGGEARFAARGGIFCVDVVFPLSKSD